jgi:hypothetical protein
MPDKRHQLGIQVEPSNRDEINDADGDAFAKQCCALGDEGVSRLRAILVRRADELDRGDQLPLTFEIEDADLVFVFVGRFRLDRDRRNRGSPSFGCPAAIAAFA